MRGTVSFHPADAAFFEGTIAALLAGRKVQPEPWLSEALRARSAWRAARPVISALERAFQQAEPPRAHEGASLFERV